MPRAKCDRLANGLHHSVHGRTVEVGGTFGEVGVERAIDYVLDAQDGRVPELDPPKRKRPG